jgi:hypothetical protein
LRHSSGIRTLRAYHRVLGNYPETGLFVAKTPAECAVDSVVFRHSSPPDHLTAPML